MIAAVYARKSTDQPGVADDAKSVTRARDGLRRAQGLEWTRPTSTRTTPSRAPSSRGGPGSSG